MNTSLKTVDQLQVWFDRYAEGFLEQDERLNANVAYKQHHSARTRQLMRFLSQQLQWTPHDVLLAEVIGLLHDVGRFEQLRRHRTYNDHQSLDHGMLGVEILARESLLDDFSSVDQNCIATAIRYHNARCLPASLEGDCLKFSRLIRDADKLDIFASCSDIYRRYLVDPQGVALEIGFSLDPYCTPEVVEATLKGRSVEYRWLQTIYDCLVMQLGWVFDLNYSVSIQALKANGALEQLMSILPDWPQMHEVQATVMRYLDRASDLSEQVTL